MISKSHQRKRKSRQQRGQMLPLFAFGLIAIISIVAIAIDIGYLRYQERIAQQTADSAAVAGVIKYYYPTTQGSSGSVQGTAPREVSDAAAAASSDNGFPDSHQGTQGDVQVIVNSPPTNTSKMYDPNKAVEVVLLKKEPQFFSGIFGGDNKYIKVRAVAQIKADINDCLYQLGKQIDGYQVITNGQAGSQINGCGIAANGTVNTRITNTSATGVPIVVSYNGAAYPQTGGLPANQVQYSQVPFTDPCFRLPGCAFISNQLKTVDFSSPIDFNTLGSISLNNISSTSINAPLPPQYLVLTNCCSSPLGPVTFGPGIYYILGGITGTIKSDGATIVNVDGTASWSGLGSSRPYFSGPTGSAPSAGVAFYQPLSNHNRVTLNGGGNGCTFLNGITYAPGADFTSNGGAICLSEAVVRSINANGHGITLDPTLGGQVPGGNPFTYATRAVLSE